MKQLTIEKVTNLLRGYRQEYPLLLSTIEAELSKENPLSHLLDALEEEVALYDLLIQSVMSLDSDIRTVFMKYYLSEDRETYETTSESLQIDKATIWKRTTKGKYQILGAMNAALAQEGIKT